MGLMSNKKGRDYNDDGEGWSSFWWPAGAALICIAVLIFIFATVASQNAVNQIEENVDKKIEKLTQPVIAVKYDSATQTRIDSIEIHRKISHDHIDNLYDNELQNVLDSTFNYE